MKIQINTDKGYRFSQIKMKRFTQIKMKRFTQIKKRLSTDYTDLHRLRKITNKLKRQVDIVRLVSHYWD